jgi:hypothetical protein
MAPRLTIDLIPRATWGMNVRTLAPKLWPPLRKKAIHANGARCASCRNAPHKAFQVHEVWEFDYLEGVQRLIAFEVLCERCHAVKHAGRTVATREDGVRFILRELVECNSWTINDAKEHLQLAFSIWHAKNLIDWLVDISYAYDYLKEESHAVPPD